MVPARDTAYRLAGKHVNSSALITAPGCVKPIVVPDVLTDVSWLVPVVLLVLVTVRVKHTLADACTVVSRADALPVVSMTVTRIAWVGVVALSVVWMLLVHVKPTAV